MRGQWRTAWIGLSPLVAMLIATLPIATLTVGVSCAAEGSSAAHGDGKGSAAPAEGGDHASSKGAGGEGAAGGAKGEAHPSSGGDGKSPQAGSTERSEPAKDTAPPVQNGKDAADTNVHVEPVRRVLDRKNRPGENNPASRTPGTQGLTRRLSPPAQAPVHNSIGVAVPPPAHVEPRVGTHVPTAVPHLPSAAPPGPGNVATRPLTKPEVPNRPIANPIVTPPAANRGAINGTGMARRNAGPPRIGGPAASVAGINGTTIRSKH
jgi:hypothetical protein